MSTEGSIKWREVESLASRLLSSPPPLKTFFLRRQRIRRQKRHSHTQLHLNSQLNCLSHTMADVAQAPLPIVPHAQPDLVRDEDDDMQAASPQESDLIPTPSDDPSSIHFAPNGTGKHLAGDMDITMNGADADHEEEDDNISVDMDTGSPTPASSHSNENVQAPPSPAPSGGDSTAKPVFQRSPSSTTALSINAHTATPDHPENSIPSPASPVAELPQMVTPTVEVEATTSITANDIELDVATPKVASVTTVTESASGLVPSASLASTSTKHEQEDADAMEEQRPAKRARTADIASVSVSSFDCFFAWLSFFNIDVFVDAIFVEESARHSTYPVSTLSSEMHRRQLFLLFIECYPCTVLRVSDNAPFTCYQTHEYLLSDPHWVPSSTVSENRILSQSNDLDAHLVPADLTS